MNKQKIIILILITLIFFILSLSEITKITHSHLVDKRVVLKQSKNHVYSGMLGLIVIDFFLISFFIIFAYLIFMPNIKLFKILFLIIIVSLVVRFILSMFFLAGNENYCREKINLMDSLFPLEKKMIDDISSHELDNYKSLKAAWVGEIVVNIFIYAYSGVVLYLEKYEINPIEICLLENKNN